MNLAGEEAEYLQVTDVVHILKPNRSFDFSASSCSLSIETQPQSIQNRSDLRARAGAEAEDGERAEAEDGRLRWRADVSASCNQGWRVSKKMVRVFDIYYRRFHSYCTVDVRLAADRVVRGYVLSN